MAGKTPKWAAFKKLYPKTPVEAELVDKVKTVLDAPAFPDDPSNALRVRDLNNNQLKDIYVLARKAADDLNLKLSVLNIQILALTMLFVERMEDEDVTSFNFTDGVSLGSTSEPWPTVTDKSALRKWCIDTHQEDLLSINSMTLAGVVKELLIDGKELPAGVDVFLRDKLTARGLKTKQGETNNQ